MSGAIVDTRSGKLQGTEHEGVLVFRGIPFARPPVGVRRWLALEPEEPWDGVRDATRFGPISAQVPGPLELAMGVADQEVSEDSLTLNVWTPGLDDAARPVMVWIHGGAWLTGAGSTPWYDGTRFARNGDVVVVTINYRLGAFGFLHLADLFGPELAGSGNAGILDQVAALEWVRDCITAFGGDPANVTIFGESAGGGSVGTLLGTPAAGGLFQGAIPQSGAASWCYTAEAATERARRVVAAAGVEVGDLDALRALTTEQVLAAQATLGNETADVQLPFQPVVDGVVLPAPPLESIGAGTAAGVRVLVGTNKDEMTLFGLVDPSLVDIDEEGLIARVRRYDPAGADHLLATYRAARPHGTTRDLWTALATDALFRIPAVRLAERQFAHGPVYKYLFAWETPALGGALGATHGLEIPFVFDTLHQPGADMFTGDGDERHALAAAMHRAWIRFAHEGDPGHDGLPAWPTYDLETRATMVFDVSPRLEHDPGGAERAAWEHLA